MANKYDLNLSSGVKLTTIYPNEVSGPNNISNKIQIQEWLTDSIIIAGNLKYRFVAGFKFDVVESGATNGVYTVVSSECNINVIPNFTTVKLTATNLPTRAGGNIGFLRYSNTDNNTTLKLPGDEVNNYGEMIVENLVHMTENWAGANSPDTSNGIGVSPNGNALTGQLWFKTRQNEEGFHFYNGTEWSNQFDYDDGAVLFRDTVRSRDIFITASTSSIASLPAAASTEGLVVWPSRTSSDTGKIFTIMRHDGTPLFQVDDFSAGIHAYTSTKNNLKVLGTGTSHISSKLNINSPTNNRTLTVGGSGIAITGPENALLEVISPAAGGWQSAVYFNHATPNTTPTQYVAINHVDHTMRIGASNATTATNHTTTHIYPSGSHTTMAANVSAGRLILSGGYNQSTNAGTGGGNVDITGGYCNHTTEHLRTGQRGGHVNLAGGRGNKGGTVSIRAGHSVTGVDTSGNASIGGAIEIWGGNGGSGNNSGGHVNLGGGMSQGTGVDGNVNVWRGNLYIHTGQIHANRGTAAKPGITMAHNTNDGIYGDSWEVGMTIAGRSQLSVHARQPVRVNNLQVPGENSYMSQYHRHVNHDDDVLNFKFLEEYMWNRRTVMFDTLISANKNPATFTINLGQLYQGIYTSGGVRRHQPNIWSLRLIVFVDSVLYHSNMYRNNNDRMYDVSRSSASYALNFEFEPANYHRTVDVIIIPQK